MEASALSAPAALRRPSRPAARLLRLRSDEQLVALFRNGSEEAFGVIHERYRQRLFAYTRQMLAGSRQDAEDALQDVFMRAYVSLLANERPVSLRAWLYRVAHNRCIDQLRRPVPAQSDVFEVSRGPLHDPLAEAERRDDLRRLISDVRRLPEAQRSALLMREMEGLSYEELSVALETTVPAIKSLLVRARIGLVEAREARDVACIEIRRQLMSAYDRGVRASGQARRHMRECDGCRAYRSELRGMRRSFAALAPAGAGGLGLLAQFGLGGAAGGGASAAGGGAAASGGAGGAAILGGGAAVATAGKVVAVVASVAVVTAGAAQEVQHKAAKRHAAKAATSHVASAHAIPSIARVSAGALAEHHPVIASATHPKANAKKARTHARSISATDIAPVVAPPSATATGSTLPVTLRPGEEFSGGAQAPDEPDPTAPPADGSTVAGTGSSTSSTGTGAPLTTLTGSSGASSSSPSGTSSGTSSGPATTGTGSGTASSPNGSAAGGPGAPSAQPHSGTGQSPASGSSG